MKNLFLYTIAVTLLVAACQPETEQTRFEDLPDSAQTISLLGDTLKTEIDSLPPALANRIDSLSALALEEDRLVNSYIWEARKMAYTGDYRTAVIQLSSAITEFPEEPRLYRHRGHRYITLREFDLAIQDFEKAASLFEGQSDVVEPDGLPNAQNTPLSSLQTNTWYHLGLAHYLKGEYEKANEAYMKGLEATDNNDMRVAFLYWKYMAMRKAGHDVEAGKVLEQVSPEMELIENTSYHELLMVFKGVFTENQILDNDNSELDNSTLGYGLGFWHDINGRDERANEIWQQVYDSNNWAAFGYIASEAELAK
ncbi:MAG TPA: tetratricopeptide repeat protein [Gracilimonas sp.]|uniref:tetratricopeptide repeat protein n=1 Tax=Gracilimonas sp. TaxID=1974203 RepID=UPI002D9A3167|nr:tetratricopeptide repeat protein [Gracilimonas sp.]